MPTRERIVQTLFTALSDLNQQLSSEKKLELSVDTVLFGKAGKLDSLGLVNFIVAVEEEVAKDFGVTITLADERALSQKSSPFRNIGTLAEYIQNVLGQQDNGQ